GAAATGSPTLGVGDGALDGSGVAGMPARSDVAGVLGPVALVAAAVPGDASGTPFAGRDETAPSASVLLVSFDGAWKSHPASPAMTRVAPATTRAEVGTARREAGTACGTPVSHFGATCVSSSPTWIGSRSSDSAPAFRVSSSGDGVGA